MNNNNMTEPLRGGSTTGNNNDDDNASQSSQRSSSLLERIRSQQQKLQQPQQPMNSQQQQQVSSVPSSFTMTSSTSSNANMNSSQVQVPQYNPVPTQENFAGGGPAPHANPGGEGDLSSSGFFRSAWNNIATSMETGMASLEQNNNNHANSSQEDYGLDDALLLPAYHNNRDRNIWNSDHPSDDYSMCSYFLMFVRDLYRAFVSVPLVAQVLIFIVLLYAAIKLHSL